ncbi:MAG: hypothetical protein KDI06_18235 [Calditrichaeota bacterium]|nr:hypothetical protein [Calditrichota bacterium]
MIKLLRFLPILLILAVILAGCENDLLRQKRIVLEQAHRLNLVRQQSYLLKWFLMRDGRAYQTGQIYAGFDSLLRPQQLLPLQNLLEANLSAPDRRDLEGVRRTFLRELNAAARAAWQDSLAALLGPDGPVRLAPTLQTLLREQDRQEVMPLEKLAAFQDSLRRQLNKSAGELGYASLLDWVCDYQNFQRDSTLLLAEQFLQEDSQLASLLKRLPGKGGWQGWMTLRAQMDRQFGDRPAYPRAQSLLSDLGILIERQSALQISAELTLPPPAPLALPISPPGDIRLAVSNREGYEQPALLLGELAKAQTGLLAAPNAASEATPGLVEGLAVLLSELDASATGNADFKLLFDVENHLTARFAAWLVFQETDQPEDRTAYGPAVIFPFPVPEAFAKRLETRRPGLDWAVRTLWGEFQARRLRGILEATFGENWYRDKAAGRHLKRWWSEGRASSTKTD